MRHFFLMLEPKGSLKDQLADPETLRGVFRIFADKKMLDIIYYMYSRLNTPIATSLISKNTGLDLDEVDRCMEILCQNNLATKSVVATADGDIYTYMTFNCSSGKLCYSFALFCRRNMQKGFSGFYGFFYAYKTVSSINSPLILYQLDCKNTCLIDCN